MDLPSCTPPIFVILSMGSRMSRITNVMIWPSTLRPQIANDLGHNVTRSSNAHRNRKRFPSGNEVLSLWLQIQIAAGLNPLRFENRKPNPPLFRCDLTSPNRKPADRNRRIRAARRPQITESPATRPLSERQDFWGSARTDPVQSKRGFEEDF